MEFATNEFSSAEKFSNAIKLKDTRLALTDLSHMICISQKFEICDSSGDLPDTIIIHPIREMITGYSIPVQ
jgi:hypothetical protein